MVFLFTPNRYHNEAESCSIVQYPFAQCLLISHNIYILHSEGSRNRVELLSLIRILVANRYSFNNYINLWSLNSG